MRSPVRCSIIIAVILSAIPAPAFGADDDKDVQYDYVTDTVTGVASKVMGVLSGQVPITVSPDNDSNPDQYTRDAIGRRVPKSTAVKSAGGLHSDAPL